MTNHAPGATHRVGTWDFADAMRGAVARGAGTLEIELMVRRQWRAFVAAELLRGLAGAAALVASAGQKVSAVLRSLRHSASAALLGLCLGAIPVRADQPAPTIMLVPFGAGSYGIMSTPTHADTLGHPAVIVVHDLLGRDSRAGRYVDQLLARGLTVLEIEAFPNSFDGAATLPPIDEHEAASQVTAAAEALAWVAGVSPHLIGAIGFGAGARAVLLAGPGANGRDPLLARALLYPGCETLRRALQGADVAPRGQVLLLHGGRDPGNTDAACAALASDIAPGAGVRHLVMPEAGYGWDYVAAGAVAGPTLLPIGGPDDGRVAADPWVDATAFAADTVSSFVATALYGAMASARRR
jgi:dienelactone hydrolase